MLKIIDVVHGEVLKDGEMVKTTKYPDGSVSREYSTKEKKESAEKEAEREAWENKFYIGNRGYFRVDTYYELLGLLLHNPMTGEWQFCPFSGVTYHDEAAGISTVEELKEITQDEAMESAKEYLSDRTNFIVID